MTEREKGKQGERQRSSDDKKALGTGVGAAAGAATGAAVGSVVPGVGNAVGAVVGGAVGLAGGAVAGKAIAQRINPQDEDDFWREQYANRTYAVGASYTDFGPAYRFGWESRQKYPLSQGFDDVEFELRADWNLHRDESRLSPDRAKHATRDAWLRAEEVLTGKSGLGRA